MTIRTVFLQFGLAVLLGLMVLPTQSNQVDAQALATSVDFDKDVKPILEDHCIKCHGPVDYDGGRLDIEEEMMGYLEAGDAENSQLYEHLVSLDEDEVMPPPDDNNPLTSDEITTIKDWIDDGAEWPDGVELVSTQVDGDEVEKGADPADEKEDPVAEAEEVDNTLFNAIGSLHPAAVHLPIGLLLAAGLFALFGIRGNFVMSDCAYYCLWVGTIGAILACVTGWWFSPMEGKGTVVELQDILDQDHKVFWHRTGGIVVTAVAFLLALFAAGARNRDPDDGVMWKLGLIVLAVGVAWTGHEGGKLTHGKNHYKDLEKLIQTIMPAQEVDDGGDESAEEGSGATSEDSEEDKTPKDTA